MQLQVVDIYEGAYLLCMGYHLKSLSIDSVSGRRKAVFIIEGEGIESESESYRSGHASVNVAMLKFTLEKLKDAMFAEIRSGEPGHGIRRGQGGGR